MSNTLEERCRHLIIQRKFEQCQKEIVTAMAENPHCAIPHNLMGILLEKESNHVLAMKHFRTAYAFSDPLSIEFRPDRKSRLDHINSYKRKKLNNRSPYDAFSFYYGEEILEKLACKLVAAENIILKPRLLKK